MPRAAVSVLSLRFAGALPALSDIQIMLIILSTSAALLYLLCAFAPARLGRWLVAGSLLAWLLQSLFLWQEAFAGVQLRLGFAMMLCAALWISVAAWWLENRHQALDGLRPLMLPCAAASCLLPLAFPGSLITLEHQSALFGWHIVIAILAYASLTIAVFHAVLMAMQETRLHHHAPASQGWFAAALDRLPALLTMEKLLFRLITFGFVLLSLTVLSGVVFSEQLFGRPLRFDHKTVFTLLSWLLFGILLAGRIFRG